MNETDCVLQGKRLREFPRLRKQMLREPCISVPVGTWRGREITLPARLCQKVSLLTNDIKKPGIEEPCPGWILLQGWGLLRGDG